LLITTGSIVVILTGLYAAISSHSVQQWIKNKVQIELSKKIDSEFTIGEIKFIPFNSLKLYDVFVKDRQGDTLVFAGEISGSVKLFPLIKNKLVITGITLSDFSVNISQDSLTTPMNFQFLIDAFTSKDTVENTPSSLIISIDNILVSNGKIRYDVHSEPETPGIFNGSHLQIDSLHSKISLKSIRLEKLDTEIKYLSLIEKSGIRINDMTLKLTSKDKLISLDHLTVKLPGSELNASGKTSYPGEIADIIDNGKIDLQIEKTTVRPSDLKSFAPLLSQFNQPVSLSGNIRASLPGIDVNDLKVSYGKNTSLYASGSISNYTDFEKADINLIINDLSTDGCNIQTIIQAVSGEKTILPDPIFGLGSMHLKGYAKGKIRKADLNLELRSKPGTLVLKGTGGYNFTSGNADFDILAESNGIQLNDLMQDNPLGQVSFSLNAKGTAGPNLLIAELSGVVPRLDFQGYCYSNIRLKGTLNQSKYTADIAIDDPNVRLDLTASADMPAGKLPEFKAGLNVDRLSPDKLNLLSEYPGSNLTLKGNIDMKGDDLDNITGKIALDNISFATETEKFNFSLLLITARFDDKNNRIFHFTHEFLTADITGKLSFATLVPQLTNTANDYFPTLFPERNRSVKPGENDFVVDIRCKNTEKLTRIFNLPFTLLKESTLHLTYNDASETLQLSGNLPQLKVGETVINNIKPAVSNTSGPLDFSLTADVPDINSGSTIQFGLKGKAEHDSISPAINFDNHNDTLALKGNINATVLFEQMSSGQSLKTLVKIEPSSLTFNKLNITIPNSTVSIENDRFIFDRLRINHTPEEYVLVDGIYSSRGKDSLFVNLNQIQLQTITETMNMDIGLTGLIQGYITVIGTEKMPNLLTRRLGINNITLNKEKIGDLSISSEWDSENEGVRLYSELKRENGINSTIRGRMYPLKDSLNIRVDLADIRLAWLQPFFIGTLHDLNGSISSKLTARGKLSSPQVNGYIYVHDGKFGIDYTNVTYTLSDSIAVNPSQLNIRNLAVKDNFGKTATLQCTVNYPGFKNISYDFSMDMRNFLVLNTMDRKDSLFYGLLKLTGKINSSGTMTDAMKVGLKLQNSSDSKIAVILPESTTATEYKSVVYVDKHTDEEVKKEKPESTFPINLKMSLDITPSMSLTVFLDPSMRDRAVVNGTGNIDMTYNTATSDMSMYGQYVIHDGSCVISLKGITKREFKISEGSEVTFNGDPFKSRFNITAYYTVKADLGTLDQSFTSDPTLRTSRTNVNCVLIIKGNMDKIDLTYDIQLPDASDETQKRVKSFINNDDIMIREFAYLLSIGCFYAPDYATASRPGNSIWTSMASSTLSATLNNLVSGVLGKNWTIGTNINSTQGDASDLDMEISVSTQLFNNRLILSTNLGYNNSNTASNSFIGDFDAELKLTRTGNLRLKAYNKTNDQYYQKAPTTQGVGLVYTKESKFFKNLFKKVKSRKAKRKRE